MTERYTRGESCVGIRGRELPYCWKEETFIDRAAKLRPQSSYLPSCCCGAERDFAHVQDAKRLTRTPVNLPSDTFYSRGVVIDALPCGEGIGQIAWLCVGAEVRRFVDYRRGSCRAAPGRAWSWAGPVWCAAVADGQGQRRRGVGHMGLRSLDVLTKGDDTGTAGPGETSEQAASGTVTSDMCGGCRPNVSCTNMFWVI